MFYILARDGNEGDWRVVSYESSSIHKALEDYALHCPSHGRNNTELVKSIWVKTNSTICVDDPFQFHHDTKEHIIHEDIGFVLPDKEEVLSESIDN